MAERFGNSEQLEAALAQLDGFSLDANCFNADDLRAVQTLAAAVRHLRECYATRTSELEEVAMLCAKAEAALAELRGRTCDKCIQWDRSGPGRGECFYFSRHTRADFTCGAWTAAKEQA
jgi:hypothetical protein